jgi:enoyl-CoA hydratase/carnithine racemase
MTGRWLDATEATALGLVNRVADDPLRAAEELAAELAAGSAGSLARIKLISATGGLLDRLHAERRANQEAWAKALATDAGTRDA